MSSRIKGITVEINADATKLSNALKEVEAKSKNLNSQGSPPRMRVILRKEGKDGKITGITPAHAGNTICLFFRHLYTRDHPRACG